VAWDNGFGQRMIPTKHKDGRGIFSLICFASCSERSSYWSEHDIRRAFDMVSVTITKHNSWEMPKF
jgi:hypothetical protein